MAPDPSATNEQWAAVHRALKARDMPAVVALLHPLAVSDPRGVELFNGCHCRFLFDHRERGRVVARDVTAINGPTWVYHVYCEHGGLLYVGVAVDVPRRIAQHRSSKKWWRADADMILAQLFPTRRQALDVEAYAVFTLRPRYNIAGAAPMDAQPHEIAPHQPSSDTHFYDSHGVAI